MLWLGSCVMGQTRQRIIHALRRERCKWKRHPAVIVVKPINNIVIHIRELWDIKNISKRYLAHPILSNITIQTLRYRKMERYRGFRHTDGDRYIMISDQEANLLL